jgi:hypothetical protein
MHLGEVLPLPSKRRGRPSLLHFEIGRDESRNTVSHWPASGTAGAHELPCIHLVLLDGFESKRIGRERTDEVSEESALHCVGFE